MVPYHELLAVIGVTCITDLDQVKNIRLQFLSFFFFFLSLCVFHKNLLGDKTFNVYMRYRTDGPFAAHGHMVQNPSCWRVSDALGHPKQRTFKFDLMKSLCSGCPSE